MRRRLAARRAWTTLVSLVIIAPVVPKPASINVILSLLKEVDATYARLEEERAHKNTGLMIGTPDASVYGDQ